MTHHDHQHRQRGGTDWDDYEHGQRGSAGEQRRSGARGPQVQDRGEYGGWASGEGQGEFAGDGYSAQGQFTNQRVAQYGDQGYGEEYGRRGIGWQNRHGEGPSDWQRDAGGGYWGQGASGGQGIGGSGSWRQEQSGNWGAQRRDSHGPSWEGSGGGTGYSAAGSWMAGPHSGRGPQGYQRSDARIEEDVCEHLTHHGMLDATGVQVQVENGEVTLTGTVESRQAKRLAEDILDGISGVRDIHNQLRVQRDRGQNHQNPFMAQAQMDQGDNQGSNGQSQGGGLAPRNESKAGARSS
jgi:osmotically-inducible protein OsmY